MLQAHLGSSRACPIPPRIRSNCSRASGPESGLVCSLAWPGLAFNGRSSLLVIIRIPPPCLQHSLCLAFSSLHLAGVAIIHLKHQASSVMLSCKLERASRALRMSEKQAQA